MTSDDHEREWSAQLAHGRLTRRRVLQGAALTTGALALGLEAAPALAQSATPNASGVTVDQLMALSAQLVGGGQLNADFGPQLLALIAKDPAQLSALKELIAGGSAATPEPASPAAKKVVANILTYWYVGEFDGNPVPDRQGLYFGLAAYQTVPYVTIQSVCKGFGYWAQPVSVTLKPS